MSATGAGETRVLAEQLLDRGLSSAVVIATLADARALLSDVQRRPEQRIG
jgi:hypothetical protein